MSIDQLLDVFIALLIVSVMLSMGLSLQLKQLTAALKAPRPLLFILLLNIVVLPLLGYLLGRLASPDLALTLLIAGAAGVGSTAPLFTANVKGDFALATAALVVSGFICLLTLPLSLWLLAAETQPLNAGLSTADVMRSAFGLMLVWQLLPLLMGMVLHRLYPEASLIWAARFKTWSNVLLLGLICGLGVSQSSQLLTQPLVDCLLMALMVVFSYLFPAFWLRQPWGSALLFCSSTRNLNLGLLLASQLFNSKPLLLSLMIYAALMYLLWPLATWAVKQRTKPALAGLG